MHSELKRDIFTFFGCIICCVSLGSSFIIPIVMRKPLSFEEETGIQSNMINVSPVGDSENWWLDPVYEPGDIYKPMSFNWSKFWKVFKNHAIWKLEAKNPSGEWVDATELLTINRNYTGDNNCKIGLEFTTPDNGLTLDWRFTLGIDYLIKSFVNKSGDYEYTLTYEAFEETFNVVFNWSDMLQYSGLIFKHGVTNDYFWFRVRRNDVPPDYHVYLDPTYTVFTGTTVINDCSSQRKLVRQSNGTLWCAYEENSDVHVAFSVNAGVTWIDREIYGDTSSDNPTIAVDSNDVVHLVFNSQKSDPDDFQLEYSNSTDWSVITQIVDDDIHYLYASIAVDSNDDLHVVFEKMETGDSNDNQVVYISSLDNGGSWSAEKILTFEANSGDDYWRPCIAIDSNDVIHIVFSIEDYSSYDDIYHMESADYGVTWTNWVSDEVMEQDADLRNPVLVIDDDDTMHVIAFQYLSTSIYYCYNGSGDSAWSEESVVTTQTSFKYPSLSVSGDNHIFIVYDEEVGKYIEYDSSWGAEQSLTSWSTVLDFSCMGSYFPIIDGLHTNRPATGFACTVSNDAITNITYISHNLTWDTVSPLYWSNSVTGYLLGGNTSSYATDIIGYLTGGNDTLYWSNSVTGYLLGGNTSSYATDIIGYLTGGNDTLDWEILTTGYLTGGNDTVSWDISTTGYLTGGNDSSWSIPITGYLTGGNDSSWSIPITGYLVAGNDTLAWTVNIPGWLSGGNDTVSWSNYVTGYLLGGNESTGAIMGTPNPANNSQTRNTALTWSIPINDTYGIFDWTINCSNGQNSSADNEANGSKTLSLTGLQYTTYTVWVNTTDAGGTEYYWYKFTVTVDFDGNFTIDVQNQKATASPTISNAVDYYRFIIEGEDGFTGETDWIPAEDIGDQLYNLKWDQEYSITMWYKNETLMGWFSRQFSTPSEPIVEIDPEEPIDVDDPPRKNIYDGVPEGMSDWWNERNDIEKFVMVLPFLVIFLFLILFSRRKRVKKYYHVKKQGEEEKDEKK